MNYKEKEFKSFINDNIKTYIKINKLEWDETDIFSFSSFLLRQIEVPETIMKTFYWRNISDRIWNLKRDKEKLYNLTK